MTEPLEACPEWQDDIAAWAVAQGSPEREAALLAHLDSCTRCRLEAEGLLMVAAVALAADPDGSSTPFVEPDVDLSRTLVAVADPPEDLGDRIGARIRRERRGHLIRRSLIAAVGAAAAAAVLVVGLAVRSDDGVAPVKGRQFAFAHLARGVDATVVVGQDTGTGSLVQLTADGLDPSTTYALWLTPPGGGYPDRVPAGTFRPDRNGHVDVRLRSGMAPAVVGRVWATTPDRQIALDTA